MIFRSFCGIFTSLFCLFWFCSIIDFDLLWWITANNSHWWILIFQQRYLLFLMAQFPWHINFPILGFLCALFRRFRTQFCEWWKTQIKSGLILGLFVLMYRISYLCELSCLKIIADHSWVKNFSWWILLKTIVIG